MQSASPWHVQPGIVCLVRQSVIDTLNKLVSHSVTQSLSHQAHNPYCISYAVSQPLTLPVMPCVFDKAVSHWLSGSVSQSLSHSVIQSQGRQSLLC